MIVTFIYRYLGLPTIYYGKYIGENIGDDSGVTLNDFLMNTLFRYFNLQFDTYNSRQNVTIGVMAIIPSYEEEMDCYSENEKNIFDLLYIQENCIHLPDVYLKGKLVQELIEE